MLSSPFTVLCIDDNVVLVDAIERRLSLEKGFDGLYRIDDFSTAVGVAVAVRASVVLLDVNLPGGIDALDVLDGIVSQVPDSPVIMFTGDPTEEIVSDARSHGARGFVSKGASAEALLDAIGRVMRGEIVIALDN
ncbi:MAG: response regulator [Gemmatimonadaceae bacterium]|jgi:DNA-binding NarL/FixJ family response regulator|nr:response regulator [Gemmatimonadaceae bacterium]MCC6244811.1 response regulator [Gemmatimonadaceae bacterium]